MKITRIVPATLSKRLACNFAAVRIMTSGPNAGKVLIAGGYNPENLPSSSTELYDPVTNSFAPPNQTASMVVGPSI
jgi:hypothetical protein